MARLIEDSNQPAIWLEALLAFAHVTLSSVKDQATACCSKPTP